MKISVLFSALVALICAIAPVQVAAQERRILPESVNLPTLEGSTLLEECRIAILPDAAEQFRPPLHKCVAIAADRYPELEHAYIRALRLAGWNLAGGAGNEYWFERPVESGCTALNVTGWPRGTEDDPRAGVVFVFSLTSQRACRFRAQ